MPRYKDVCSVQVEGYFSLVKNAMTCGPGAWLNGPFPRVYQFLKGFLGPQNQGLGWQSW